jgi:hypothetical protein
MANQLLSLTIKPELVAELGKTAIPYGIGFVTRLNWQVGGRGRLVE